jgi:Arc/MetJ-type ribon-helix-helix transcriptional regulator
MAKAKSATRKKTGRPATGRDSVKTVRMSSELAERIDQWAERNGIDSYSEALRHLLELGRRSPKRKASK